MWGSGAGPLLFSDGVCLAASAQPGSGGGKRGGVPKAAKEPLPLVLRQSLCDVSRGHAKAGWCSPSERSFRGPCRSRKGRCCSCPSASGEEGGEQSHQPPRHPCQRLLLQLTLQGNARRAKPQWKGLQLVRGGPARGSSRLSPPPPNLPLVVFCLPFPSLISFHFFSSSPHELTSPCHCCPPPFQIPARPSSSYRILSLPHFSPAPPPRHVSSRPPAAFPCSCPSLHIRKLPPVAISPLSLPILFLLSSSLSALCPIVILSPSPRGTPSLMSYPPCSPSRPLFPPPQPTFAIPSSPPP